MAKPVRETQRADRIRQVVAEFLARRASGGVARESELIATYPDLMPELGEELARVAHIDAAGATQRLNEFSSIGPDFETTVTHERPSSFDVGGQSLPKQIGRYRLQRIIGAGGMGTVYEALQQKPQRTVAIKLMHPEVASQASLRRFEYESQILAHLRHPGIAQVFEAGTYDEGGRTFPYFAMEYIPRAKSIVRYADENKLNTHGRLMLFAAVCDAVHHGHQKGVIHRDLKPANILVDDAGQVKVIDFGVARATDSDLAATTINTGIGQLVGTLQYMSPEQCAADPNYIDTRTDVYSLGVVLFELLTSRLPYDVRSRALHEATRVIRESPPTRPSTLNRTLRGDLETIVMKALEKDRTRRYQTAADLSEDIAHFLAHEPIRAKPPSALYKARKLIRRRRVPLAVAAVILMAVGVALERQVRASWNAAKHRIVENAYAVFYAAQPDSALGDNKAQIIADCSRAIAADPSFAMAYALRGRANWWIGNYEAAWRDCRKALSLEPENALAQRTLGHLHFKRGEMDEARMAFDVGFEKFLTNQDLPRDLHNRARVHQALGDYEGAVRYHDAGLGLRATTRGYISRSLIRRFGGDLEGAIADFERAILLPDGPQWVAQIHVWMWEAYELRGEAGDPERARTALARAAQAATTSFEQMVIAMIQGTADASDVMSRATTAPLQCCAHYYRGVLALIGDKSEAAREQFRKCIDTAQHELPEYMLAEWHVTNLISGTYRSRLGGPQSSE